MPTRDQLFLAYRQAKLAVFFEHRGVGLLRLAAFERDLLPRLTSLAQTLSANGGWFDGLPVGELWVVPKKLRHLNDDDVVRRGARSPGANAPALDVQLRLTPSPEFLIVETLFLWQFGPVLERLIPQSALAHRLDVRRGGLSHTRRWLFQYWPKHYQDFRTVPIRTAARELRADHSVVLLSGDLASYYDTINPTFLLADEFLATVTDALTPEDANRFDVAEYRDATGSLLRAYSRFQRLAARRTGLDWSTGIPIGALTSVPSVKYLYEWGKILVLFPAWKRPRASACVQPNVTP